MLLNSITRTVSANVLLFLFSNKLDFKNIQSYNTVKLISFNQNCQHCQHTNTKHRHKSGTHATGSYWVLCFSFPVVLSQHVQLQCVIKRIGHTVQYINSMNHANHCLFMIMSYCTMQYETFCIVWTYTTITLAMHRLGVMIMACLTEVHFPHFLQEN